MTRTAADSSKTPIVAITGSNRGIGRGILEAIARAGFRVVAHARHEDAAATSARRAEELGADAVAVSGDLLDAALPKRLLNASVETFGGPPQAVILNAALLGPMLPLGETSTETFDQIMAVNVNAQFALTRTLLPAMLEAGGGALVYLSSGLGRFALPGYGIYTVSKHAIEGLAKQVAADHGEAGIYSVNVAPGMVQTEMLKTALGSDDVSAHDSPERVGEGFRRLVEDLLSGRGPELSGQSLDIAGWLQAAE